MPFPPSSSPESGLLMNELPEVQAILEGKANLQTSKSQRDSGGPQVTAHKIGLSKHSSQNTWLQRKDQEKTMKALRSQKNQNESLECGCLSKVTPCVLIQNEKDMGEKMNFEEKQLDGE